MRNKNCTRKFARIRNKTRARNLVHVRAIPPADNACMFSKRARNRRSAPHKVNFFRRPPLRCGALWFKMFPAVFYCKLQENARNKAHARNSI
ncbi:MAG: hypothetical protein DBX55_01870 [Verrucomicrobia bacterium]|nr:MAG: hypothetical protein DBX55_01870 [Verrucomicrobiota bacterium]